LVALGGVMVVVTYSVAVHTRLSQDWMVQWIKLAIIFPMLLSGVIRSRAAFNAFAVVHMLGAFWWGYDAWTRPKRAQGRLLNVGSGDSLSDNAASAHLLTVLPFIAVYLLTEKDKRLRAVALLAAPFVINTLILCNSRGAMVGLAGATVAALFLIRSGYRIRIFGTALALASSVVMLADDTFIRRQQTTTQYEEDGSAMQRLETWKGGLQLAKDRPLGAGGRGFHLLSPTYIPNVVAAHGGDARAPHNTWVMVLTEWGIAGFICFIGLNVSVLLLLERLKRRVASDHNGSYYYWRGLALQLAIIAGLLAGLFTDRLYGESGYWMIGLSIALNRIQLTDAAEKASSVSAPAPMLPAHARAAAARTL
jgi:O-antigen ligase